jgi:DNA-binding transcriptional regulator YiaG
MTERHEYFIKDEPVMTEAFHYTMCGLPNIYLLNGVSFHDEGSYGTSYEIRNLESLHEAIAANIITRTGEMMSGAELRFLRKRMKNTQAELAKRLRVGEQTVANYEKGASAINGPTDFMMRTLYLLHVLPEDARMDRLEELAEAVSNAIEMDDQIVHRQTEWNEARHEMCA